MNILIHGGSVHKSAQNFVLLQHHSKNITSILNELPTLKDEESQQHRSTACVAISRPRSICFVNRCSPFNFVEWDWGVGRVI